MMDKEENQDDFDEVYKDFYRELWKILYRIVGRGDAAEDLCQESFIRYYGKRDKLPRGEARFWLIRIAKNLAYNYLKRQKREGRAYREWAAQPQEFSQNEGEKKLLEEESRLAVREALQGIPYKLRVALILKEYFNYSYRDIARSLNISEGNVKIRIYRARQSLLKIYGGQKA